MLEVTTDIENGRVLKCDLPILSECDRYILKLLLPHMIQAKGNQLNGSYTQHVMTQFKQVVEGRGAIFLALNGQVKSIAERAEELLEQYFSSQGSETLPESLLHWYKHQISQQYLDRKQSHSTPLRIEQAKQQLIVRLIFDLEREEYLLLLEERELPSFSIAALELIGLTKREAEVLFWIAKDKSTAGISRVLDCGEGTVRKHLQNIYKKLGVQTRMGAVMVALERLGILKG